MSFCEGTNSRCTHTISFDINTKLASNFQIWTALTHFPPENVSQGRVFMGQNKLDDVIQMEIRKGNARFRLSSIEVNHIMFQWVFLLQGLVLITFDIGW